MERIKTVSTLTLACGGVGQLLIATGTGYKPRTNYEIDFIWPSPNGEAGTAVATDDNGDFTDSLYANWSGSYTVQVLDEHTRKVIASASITVT